MTDERVPNLYGNIVQVTRTPWEVNFHVLQVVTPREMPPGTVAIKALEYAREIGVITLPLEVAKSLIEVLQKVTAGEIALQDVKESRDA